MLGLLDRKINLQTLEFKRSLLLRSIFYLSLLSKVLTIKFIISYWFPKTHYVQLILGSFFNYLPDRARFFMGLAVIIRSVQ